ncbi:MAG: protein kinase, partial [Anaerolineae bacterium]|nr:protein kinase [Anaerolineae bacterium]
MPLETGQVLNNRYRIVKLLGQGGFGAVYRAWDSNLNRPCAVKENLDTSPEAQRQFTREATVLANLSHPNLPRVTDHFILSDQG